MDSLVVVVKDGHRNRLMEPCEIAMSVQVAELQLEVTEPPLHKAVLPWAGALAATERYLHPLTQFLVFVAQVFRALVAVQDSRARVFA